MLFLWLSLLSVPADGFQDVGLGKVGKLDPAPGPGEKSETTKIAFCLAGGVRTLTEDRVQQSILVNLTGGADLFLALYTGYDAGWKGPLEQSTPEELESMLANMAPKGVTTLGQEGKTQCNQTEEGKQWNVWSTCADMIEKHESQNNFKYDLIFRSRPDMLWNIRPNYLNRVAEKYEMTTRRKDLILTAEDQIQFFHRENLGMLKTFRNLNCPEICNTCKAEYYERYMREMREMHPGSHLYQSKIFIPVTPYCVTVKHYKINGLEHIEAKDHAFCKLYFNDCENVNGGKATFEGAYQINRPLTYRILEKLNNTKFHVLLKWHVGRKRIASEPLTAVHCERLDSKYTCRKCISGFATKHKEGENFDVLMNKMISLPLCDGVNMQTLRENFDKGEISDSVPLNMHECMTSLATKLRADPVKFVKESRQALPCGNSNKTIATYMNEIYLYFD